MPLDLPTVLYGFRVFLAALGLACSLYGKHKANIDASLTEEQITFVEDICSFYGVIKDYNPPGPF